MKKILLAWVLICLLPFLRFVLRISFFTSRNVASLKETGSSIFSVFCFPSKILVVWNTVSIHDSIWYFTDPKRQNYLLHLRETHNALQLPAFFFFSFSFFFSLFCQPCTGLWRCKSANLLETCKYGGPRRWVQLFA